MRFKTVYPGIPKPQARARHWQGVTYTEKATRERQAGLKHWLAAEMCQQDLEPIDGPLMLVCRFVFVPPPSWAKWRQQWAMQHESPRTGRGDLDNLLKLVSDAANGVLWLDDRQVSHVRAASVYGPVPQTVIACEELPGIPETKRAAQDLVRLVG